MSYTVPSLYPKDSTSTFINKNNGYNKNIDIDKLDYCKIAFIQNQSGDINDEELEKYLIKYYGGKNE